LLSAHTPLSTKQLAEPEPLGLLFAPFEAGIRAVLVSFVVLLAGAGADAHQQGHSAEGDGKQADHVDGVSELIVGAMALTQPLRCRRR